MTDDPVSHLLRSPTVGTGAVAGAFAFVGSGGRVRVTCPRPGGAETGDSGTSAASMAGTRVHWWVNDTASSGDGPATHWLDGHSLGAARFPSGETRDPTQPPVTGVRLSNGTRDALATEVMYDELTSAYD